MKYEVISDRLAWPAGTVLPVRDLAGCNIEALVAGGHLRPVKAPTKRLPAKPVPDPEPGQED